MVAEGEGFEPPEVLPSLVFKTSAFVHSATPPQRLTRYITQVVGFLTDRPEFHGVGEARNHRVLSNYDHGVTRYISLFYMKTIDSNPQNYFRKN